MDQQQAAEVLRILDLRTKRMEQILPDLPTRAEMRAAIDSSIQAAVAPLATREELREAVAPLATREEMWSIKHELQETMADWREELRRHAQVLVEEVRDDTRFYLEAMGITADQLTGNYAAVRARMEEMVRTAAQQHVSCRKTHEEWRAYFEDKLKKHAKELAEFRKKVEKIRAAAKAGAGRPTRKVS